MGFTVGGKLHKIFETKQITERFRKREFVVELMDNPQYPQMVMFQLTGDRCGQLDEFNVDDEVSIEFSLRGREWTSPQGEVKYFNSLDVWKLERAGDAPPPGFDEEPPLPDSPPPGFDADDDIPF
jgi:hypothetical protein